MSYCIGGIFMKSFLVLVLISCLFVNAYSQKKMTPRELAGLKGNVKSVVVETAFLEINQKKYNADNRITEAEDFYDRQGNVKNNPRKPDSGDVLKYVFDRRGRIVEERKIDADGNQWAKTEFKYDSKGQISERIYYFADTLITDFFYTYDDKKNLTESKIVPAKDGFIKETVAQRFKDYKFDARGNWIQRTVETTSALNGKSEKNITISYRKIEYFN
jgi:hypothetical protein